MFGKNSFLRRLFGSFFSRSSREAHSRKRSLQMESLEAREMLSGDGLHLPLDSQDDSALIISASEPVNTDSVILFGMESTAESVPLIPTVWIDRVEDATEGNTNGRFVLKRNSAIGTLKVNYNLGGTSSNNTDYEYLNTFVTFSVGEDTAYVNVVPHDDHLVEQTKTVTLDLRDGTVTNGILSYTVDTEKRSATLTLYDNEVSPKVWVDSVTHATEGVSKGYFVLKRDNTTLPLDVRYGINGTTSHGSDYESLSGYATFAAGEDTVHVYVVPHDDHLVEATETVILTIQNADSPYGRPVYTIDETKSSGVLEIYDNEIAPHIEIDGVVNATEGRDYGYVIVKRDNVTDPLTFRYGISGTATNNSDYEYLYTYATFTAGEDTIHVKIVPHDDHSVEVTKQLF
jgi:hypothetical protein